MDFSTPEETNDLGGLVRDITESVCTPAHHKELDKLDQRFDRALWGKLVDADVLSAAAPESLGGGGFGVLEQSAILTALGRQLAAVPYLESVVLAAGALAKFGSQALQDEWATPAVKGEKILTVALDGETPAFPSFHDEVNAISTAFHLRLDPVTALHQFIKHGGYSFAHMLAGVHRHGFRTHTLK